ncbi:MAG: nucleotidyltransferase domain-containing protein [Candidatus Babeliaceae bacterium]|jgi:predicted nucleotidyltransferase
MNNAILPYKAKLIKAIEYHMPEAKIYLFGSQATNTAKISSDIDIAIDDTEKIPMSVHSHLLNTIDNLNVPYTVDIVDINAIPEDFKTRIMKEKVVWKS